MINFYKKFSSPLKIILSGEHSVVYGKNAIAAAINLRYYCEIHEIEKDTSNFNFFFNNEIIESFGIKNFIKHCDKIYSEGQKSVLEYNVFHEKTSKNLDYLSICKDKDLFYVLFYLFIEKFETKSREKLYDYFQNHSFDLRITTKVPDLTGVGSSASYLSTISACLIKYFDFVYKNIYNEQTEYNYEDFQTFMQIVNKRTFIFEKIYHANPSGIDNTVITHGGFMIYNKVTGMKFIKSNFLNQFFDLYIINTKIIKNSKVAIETVRKIYESKSEAKDYINKIGEITDKILEIITEDTSELNNLKGMENFRNLIQENQRLLSLFDLSNGKIDLLLEISKNFGVISKITGSGQGGCCLSFLQKNMDETHKKKFLKELENKDFEIFEVSISTQGLTEEFQ